MMSCLGVWGPLGRANDDQPDLMLLESRIEHGQRIAAGNADNATSQHVGNNQSGACDQQVGDRRCGRQLAAQDAHLRIQSDKKVIAQETLLR